MRRIWRTIILIMCCIVICGGTCEAAKKKKVNVKTSFAQITDAKMNKKKLKKNDVFEYSFKISLVKSFNFKSRKLEEGPFHTKSPYYYVKVCWKSSKSQELEQTFKWKASKKSKTIKGKIPIYSGMQTGKWQLSCIWIMDHDPHADNETYGSILYISDGTKKQQKKSDKTGNAYRNLSFGDFKVTGKRKADLAAPTFDKESLSVSSSEVNPGEKVVFSVRVEDESAVADVYCGWRVINDEGFVDDLDYTMKYNKNTQRYECEIELGIHDKVVKLDYLAVYDIYGNGLYRSDECYPGKDDCLKNEYHDAFSKMIIHRK